MIQAKDGEITISGMGKDVADEYYSIVYGLLKAGMDRKSIAYLSARAVAEYMVDVDEEPDLMIDVPVTEETQNTLKKLLADWDKPDNGLFNKMFGDLTDEE